MKKILITGGSGYVGSHLLKRFKTLGHECVFTYNNSEDKAQILAKETGYKAIKTDLAYPGSVDQVIGKLTELNFKPDIFIHATCVALDKSISDIELDPWNYMQMVNCYSAVELTQKLISNFGFDGGNVLFLGAMDRSQSLGLPISFAGTQGMLNGLAMSMAKELGEKNIRVNMLTFGMLEEGMSSQFNDSIKEDYLKYSAMKRLGTADEVSKYVSWMVLDNSYVSGKVIAINGGV